MVIDDFIFSPNCLYSRLYDHLYSTPLHYYQPVHITVIFNLHHICKVQLVHYILRKISFNLQTPFDRIFIFFCLKSDFVQISALISSFHQSSNVFFTIVKLKALFQWRNENWLGHAFISNCCIHYETFHVLHTNKFSFLSDQIHGHYHLTRRILACFIFTKGLHQQYIVQKQSLLYKIHSSILQF